MKIKLFSFCPFPYFFSQNNSKNQPSQNPAQTNKQTNIPKGPSKMARGKKNSSILDFFLWAWGSPESAETKVQMISLETSNRQHRVGRWNPTYTKKSSTKLTHQKEVLQRRREGNNNSIFNLPTCEEAEHGNQQFPSCEPVFSWGQLGVEENSWAVSWISFIFPSQSKRKCLTLNHEPYTFINCSLLATNHH